MNNQKAILFLNGDSPQKAILENFNFEEYYVVCADGAYNYAKDIILPNLILGDFDSLDIASITPNKKTEIKKFPIEKDYTDGYLAILEIANRGYKNIDILGGGGGRIDHAYVNYELLSLCCELKINARMMFSQFNVFCLDSNFNDGIFKAKSSENKIVSIVAFTDMAHILNTKGLKYACHDLPLHKIGCNCTPKTVMGISNSSISNNIEIRISCGKALVFLEK